MINRLRGRKMEVRQKPNGEIRMFFRDKELRFELLSEHIEERKIFTPKDKVNWYPAKKWHPDRNHPWKKFGYQIGLSAELTRQSGKVL